MQKKSKKKNYITVIENAIQLGIIVILLGNIEELLMIFVI